jgi:DNA-directed RNA polymerase subunit RPC12/RpoP
MAQKIVASCIECGKKLQKDEVESGFCAECNAKIENDLVILRESEGQNFAFLSEIAI